MVDRKSVDQHPRETCFFCECEGPIETHHILPQRFSGSNVNANLVSLCSNCHGRLEQLYSDSIWKTFSQKNATEVEKPDCVPMVATIVDQQVDNHERRPIDEVVTSCTHVYDIDEASVYSALTYLQVEGEIDISVNDTIATR